MRNGELHLSFQHLYPTGCEKLIPAQICLQKVVDSEVLPVHDEPCKLKTMLARIKKSIARVFLGEAVSETDEIYRSSDTKFRIHLGLFRKQEAETVWLKFVHRSFLSYASNSFAIEVDSFQSFADFFATSRHKDSMGGNNGNQLPLLVRWFLKLTDGVSESTLLGEYRSDSQPKTVTRLYSYKNRAGRHRAVLEQKVAGDHSYDAFDFEALSCIENEIKKRL